MSLGSRFVNWGKTAVIASPASTPREPLLFLYPAWTRSSAVSAPLEGPPQSCTIHRSKPIAKVSIQQTRGIHVSTNNHLDNGAPEQGRVIADTGSHLPQDGIKSIENNKSLRQLSNRNRSTLPPPESKIRRIIQQNFYKVKRSEERNREVRSEYQSARRAMKNPDYHPDWRVVLSTLVSNTPKEQRWLEAALSISVPEIAVQKLLLDIDNNIWDISSRYGCSVSLADQEPNTKGRTIFLSGGAVGISKAAIDIVQTAPEVKITTQVTNPAVGGIKTGLAMTGYSETSEVQRLKEGSSRRSMADKHSLAPIRRADKISKPVQWTQHSFADYVKSLTTSGVPNHLQNLFYGNKKNTDHNTAVRDIIRKIFQDPRCKNSLSRTAFDTAISYFISTGQILDARMFFVQMEILNIPASQKTFNILLRGAAKNEDLHNFHFILNIMLRKKLTPNAGTWIAFLTAVPDLRIKLYVWSKMEECGLLRQIGTLRKACEHIVIHEIMSSLEKGETQKEFLDYMDSRYGSSWLTRKSSNRIINVLGVHGLISRCWDFFLVMDSRFITPDMVSINTVLNHCKQSGNITGALEFLTKLSSSFRFVLDETCYHSLFQMAWRGKRYNLAKVIWRYACLNGATSSFMRRHMLISLTTSWRKNRAGLSSRQYFGHTAGLFIGALEHLQNHPRKVFRREFRKVLKFDMFAAINREDAEHILDRKPWPPELAERGIIPFISFYPQKGERPDPLKLSKQCQLFLDQECRTFELWEPVRPFAELLVEAQEKDLDWMDSRPFERHGTKADMRAKFKWQQENSITVPLKAKDNSLPIEMVWK